MCRMFAMMASHVTTIDDDVVSANRSLRCQSECDRTSRQHADGWGIASLRAGKFQIHRGVEPAFADDEFQSASRQVNSTATFAHVRKASRGEVKLANTHPFFHDGWLFMHNGTLTAVDVLRDQMLREVSASQRKGVKGDTDSELIFYWLLRRLQLAGAINRHRCNSLLRISHVVGESILELDRRNQAAETERGGGAIARLNVVITNGHVMAGTRLRNSLYSLSQTHTRVNPQRPYRCQAIASEPIDDRDWQEVPDGSVYCISSGLQWRCEPMSATRAIMSDTFSLASDR